MNEQDYKTPIFLVKNYILISLFNYYYKMKLQNLSYDIKAPGAKKAIIRFFILLSLLFTAWLCLNFFVLRPTRVIDRPLTNLLTISAAKCISILYPAIGPLTWAENEDNQGSHIKKNNKRLIGIGDMCNGVDLMFTYLSVIILLPYPIKRKIIFSIGGILSIIIANIIRITALYSIYANHSRFFDFNHHYLFTLLMDLLIFYGWLLFTKKKKLIA